MWEHLDKFLTVIGVLGALYSAGNWWSYRRREKKLSAHVIIRLVQAVTGSVLYELPYQPQRRFITRAEVLGFLGMVSGGRRFDIAFISTPDFLQRIEDVFTGHLSVLDIKVTAEEFAPFNPATSKP